MVVARNEIKKKAGRLSMTNMKAIQKFQEHQNIKGRPNILSSKKASHNRKLWAEKSTN